MATGSQGGAEAAKRMLDRAQRMRDHSVPLKVFGAEILAATERAFQASQGVDGTPWPPLAASTIIARHLKRAGGRPKGFKAKHRGKGSQRGHLTDSARLTRMEAVLSGAGIKPLIDTGRMKNSQRATLRGARAMIWSAVGYMGPHITGSEKRPGRPPMRNPTVFDNHGDGARLKPAFAKRLTDLVRQYIETGAVA